MAGKRVPSCRRTDLTHFKLRTYRSSQKSRTHRTYRFRLDELPRYSGDIARTLADRGVLVQPFLPEIVTGGELSLLFFDGVYSHAVCKRPKAGDYRVQFQFGGTTENVEVSEALVAQARVCIGHAPTLPVYARVDGVVKFRTFPASWLS